MRILFTRFPLESALGGAEIQTLSLIDGLSARGHAVAFLGSCPVLLQETRRRQLPCAELHIGPPPVTKFGTVSFAWRRWGMAAKLQRAMEEFSSLDAVYMLSLTEKLLLTAPLAKRGIKVFWVEHDRVGPWLRQNPWLPELKAASAHATTVCVSELSKALYVEMGWSPKHTVAIPNGIDLRRFAAVTPRAATGGPLHVGCIARLSPEKGVDVMIRAAAPLPGVLTDITGTGPQEAALLDLIGSLGARTTIRIHPKPADIGGFYGGIDALVLPSREHDPYGLTAAEAMAIGIPVIVTDACGIAGQLHHGKDALIVRAGDEAALRAAIVQMQDPALRARLATEGRKTALAGFGVERMLEAYEKLL